MDGFKNSTRMRTFTSGADVQRTAGRTVGRVQSFAQGGAVRRFAEGGTVGGLDESWEHERNENPNGNALIQRDDEQPTEELEKGGGRSPLRSGYARGGKTQHFHVHKHYHEGGKIRTESKSYTKGAKTAEREAERQVEGAGPMMSKGGKPFGKIKKGALHKDMGVPAGKKIPTGKIKSKLAHDKASGNTKGVKRDVFALNARKFHHADGGHIHDETHIPSSYPDYATGGTINPMATGGTINPMSAGGAAYGGMATGGTINPMAVGGMPGRGVMVGAPAAGSALAGPSGALAARRAAQAGRPMPAAIGSRPLMRARGGRIGPR